jgi:ligand-binding sensor domain-containing protein
MPNYHVTIQGADREAMADLVRVQHVHVYRQTVAERDSGYRVSARADDETIKWLIDTGYWVDRHEDLDQAGRDSLRQVGQGNRFLDPAGEM